MTCEVIIVGAGAAGLMAGARCSQRGFKTLLLEKNKKLGVKILMSGGTRCNITHNTDARGIVQAFGRNGSFLHSALAALSPERVVELMNEIGVPTKVEETGKVFPVSDRALDVRDALVRYAEQSGCQISSAEPVTSIRRTDEGFVIVTTTRELSCRRLILTTGGKSYPGCGTTGDGFAWAQQLGHSIVPPRPALTPILTGDHWMHELSGLTLENVELSLFDSQSANSQDVNQNSSLSPDLVGNENSSLSAGLGGESKVNQNSSLSPVFRGEGRVRGRSGAKRPLDRRRGSFLFTHFGLSGPVALDISGSITACANPTELILRANFLPDVSPEAFRQQLNELSRVDGKRHLISVLTERLPKSLARALAQAASIVDELPMAELSRAKQDCMIEFLFRCPIKITGTKGFDKAEVTAGGISLNEVDSRTMQSKIVPGLFLAGEILDLDGPIGGFNFQSAFSTGWRAGDCA